MRVILHIPTGEIVEFVKLNVRGRQSVTGLYFVFKTKTWTACSGGLSKNILDQVKFRSRLLETDDPRLLLHSLCSHAKFMPEEFEIIDINE